MLACLPGPGDLSLQLLSHTQMNTGLQKWGTTQRMRSAQHPTPAELDAYAKKVANNPLTIKIFPNSVKVPQRNHVRRTVNGLDTSGPRYSPYPPSSQTSTKAGLLAIVKAPVAKGIVKDFDGSRARLPADVIMNAAPPRGPYAIAATASASTLNMHHPASGLQRAPPQQQPQPHTQTFQPLGPQAPMVPTHTALRHPPSLPQQHAQVIPQPQTLSHPSVMGHPVQAPSAGLLQQQHHQPPQQQQHLHQPPPGLLPSVRKMADGDAPPNVTVSTSTIPLSMVSALQQGRQPDLTSIVHQINQFCQARAQGAGSTSMCEGQIANPSPISRNLLINASCRVSMLNNNIHPHPQHHQHPGSTTAPPPGLMHPSCLVTPMDKNTVSAASAAQAPVRPVNPPNMAAINGISVYHSDLNPRKQHQQQLLQQQQQQNHHHHQQLRSWNPHQLAHQQHMPEGAGHVCKQPPSRDQGFPCKGSYSSAEISGVGGPPYPFKPLVDKPTPSPPVLIMNNNNNGVPMGQHYTNGHYFQQQQQQVAVWNNILPTPNSDSSGSLDLPGPYHGVQGPAIATTGTTAATAIDCGPPAGGTHYRSGVGVGAGAGVGVGSLSSCGQTNLMQTADYLSGDFQTPCFRDQNLGLMGKMHRAAMGRPLPEAHGQHPGYR